MGKPLEVNVVQGTRTREVTLAKEEECRYRYRFDAIMEGLPCFEASIGVWLASGN